jgi:hypothetical protein
MDYTILKEDLNLMVEASRRIWHVEDHNRIKNSAEEIRKLIDLSTPREPEKHFYKTNNDLDNFDSGYYYFCPNCKCNIGQYSDETEDWFYKENNCSECRQAIYWSE